MVKGRVAPSECLFHMHVATQTEKDQYTLIEQSQWSLNLEFINTTQLYNQLIINPAIALHVYMQLRYIMCMTSLLSSQL